MAKRNKLDIKDSALILSNTANADSVPPTEVAIESRLRPVGLVVHEDRALRRRRAPQLLRLRDVLAQRLLDLLGRGRGAARKLERDAGRVAVENRHAVARRADLELTLVLKGGEIRGDGAEDLLRLRLKLVLLARDERDDVVNHVHGRDARVAGARDGLHGDNGDLVDGAEDGLQGRERDDEADDGAV